MKLLNFTLTTLFSGILVASLIASNSKASAQQSEPVNISQEIRLSQSRNQVESQNITRFKQYEIGKLSTGERVLRVPIDAMQQNIFREAVRQFTSWREGQIFQPSRLDKGTFIWDGRQLLRQFKSEAQQVLMPQRILHEVCDSQEIFLVYG